MCTAISFSGHRHYFGRNLDLDRTYGEAVTVTPRNYPFRFRTAGALSRHHAIIGMAAVQENYPLYFDAVNERGLGMAGLNFPASARYAPVGQGSPDLAPFELIPWVLGRFSNVAEAKTALQSVRIGDLSFRPDLPNTPLHWLLADRHQSLVIESTQDGLQLYGNPVDVLTNEPPFPLQLFNLNNFMQVTAGPPRDRFAPGLELQRYSLGMGGMGLPGDWSSMSRFVRAVFLKENSLPGEGVGHFFHLLAAVAMPRGAVLLENGRHEITQYSCCMDTAAGIYYYTTYENQSITALDLGRCDPEGTALVRFPLQTAQRYLEQN